MTMRDEMCAEGKDFAELPGIYAKRVHFVAIPEDMPLDYRNNYKKSYRVIFTKVRF